MAKRRSLADKLKGVLPTEFRIFSPFQHSTGKDVWIFTWGISDPFKMAPVVQMLERAKSVRMLVGYNKNIHHPIETKEILQAYVKLGWSVRVLPGMHCKIWVVGKDAYVGSANFSPCTIGNLMCKVSRSKVSLTVNCYGTQGFDVNSGLDLLRVPQAAVHPNAQVT